MTPEQFMANFGVIAEAREGVARLRELVRSLAISARLVQSSQNETPAREIVEEIRQHREEVIRQDKRKKPRSLPAGQSVSLYDIPSHWCWATADELTEAGRWITYGILKAGPHDPNGVPYVRIGEMKTGVVDVDRLPRCRPERAAKFAKATLQGGDLLVSKDGTIGKTAFVPPELAGGNITQHVLRFAVAPQVSRHYVRLAVDSPWCQGWMKGETKGIALQGVNVGDFRRMPIPLPPLAEQKRIVAKVDQLMAMLDDLEQRQEKKRTVAIHVSKASLDSLVNAEDPDQLARAWERVSKNFGVVASQPESFERMRSAVLALAVRGALSTRSGDDAKSTLEAIRSVREQLHSDGRAQRVKPSDPVEAAEAPHRLPATWTWVRVEELCTYIVDCLHKTPQHVEDGPYPSIRTSEITPGKLLVDQALRVSEATYQDRIRRLRPHAGDVIYAREGGRYGVAATVPSGTDLCLGQRTMMFRVTEGVDPDYFMWAFNSETIFAQARATVGGSASPHVNIRAIRRFHFPLPPASEQPEIVRRLRGLYASLGELERAEHSRRGRATRLALTATRV